MQDHKFDLEAFREEAVTKLQDGKGLLGKDGAFTPLLKAFLEQAMEGELDAHIAEEERPNRKNGKGKKVIRTSLGEVEITHATGQKRQLSTQSRSQAAEEPA